MGKNEANKLAKGLAEIEVSI